jgi:hypothetical protein
MVQHVTDVGVGESEIAESGCKGASQIFGLEFHARRCDGAVVSVSPIRRLPLISAEKQSIVTASLAATHDLYRLADERDAVRPFIFGAPTWAGP